MRRQSHLGPGGAAEELALSAGGRAARGALAVELAMAVGALPLARHRAQLRALQAAEGEIDEAVYGRIWAKAAKDAGALVKTFGDGLIEVARGETSARIWRAQVPLDDGVSLRVAADKPLCHRLIAHRGIAVPDHVVLAATDRRGAESFLRATGRCVVKPAAGTGRGAGVTAGVANPADLRRARLSASRWSPRLLIERHLVGTEFRVLVLDGRVLDVIRRRPPTIVADGRRPVHGLVAELNAARLAARGDQGMFPVTLDLDCILALEHAGLSPRSVPAMGEEVILKSTANQNGPRDNARASGALCENLLGEVLDAVDAVGLRLASVELITPLPQLALGESGGAIIEVNGDPGLHYHYQLSGRDEASFAPQPGVAAAVLEALLSRGHGRTAPRG